MSQVLIQAYLRELVEIKQFTSSTNETVLREAFKTLLKDWGKGKGLFFTAEYPIENAAFKHKAAVDGALLHELRQPFGYWESKDENDHLDIEIEKKLKRGYPQDNIIFEDTRTLVLIQNRQEVGRCDMQNAQDLERFMKAFFAYERPEIAQFEKAVQQFKIELPTILNALRGMIAAAETTNTAFKLAASEFLQHCQSAINPTVSAADVSEMLLQHILTEEIFTHVFNEGEFHRQNNIAKSLYELEATFFTGALKKNTLKSLEPYYAAIRSSAAIIGTHSEKQKFLKAIYENFYQSYNRKAADRLGVVYTPNEIVRFMIDSTDWLTQKHFTKNLIHQDVEILDPATGTGTFICELLEYFKGSPKQLEHKFKHELFANEVAILPYYVANLNIEATYAAIAGEYAEFPNLCFMDTLDNMAFSKDYKGAQAGLDMGFSDENVARIKRQNSKKISVIIGNPPYNANQLNENDNNKNREYPHIDARIKQTYIAESTAQKTKLYDMYTRFFRWASDRLSENGVLAFVSNSSFLDSRSYDGFRKTIAKEFNEIYVIDLKGNARTSGERRKREAGNVFDDKIRVGIAIYFCVRKKGLPGCRIFYQAVDDYTSASEKLVFLDKTKLYERAMHDIKPDLHHNWLNLPSSKNDYDALIPVVSKAVKSAQSSTTNQALFKLYSLGVSTNRDEWVIDFDAEALKKKVQFFLDIYKQNLHIDTGHDTVIKWSRDLKRKAARGKTEPFNEQLIWQEEYRPFFRQYIYASHLMVDLAGNMRSFNANHPTICITGPNSSKPFHVLATTAPFGLDFLEKTIGFQAISNHGGEFFVDNITDWGLAQFVQHYGDKITKEAIFHYVYAVLHNPAYREKYAINLKREFPRIPLYGNSLKDFERWSSWGAALMALHIGYENIEPFELQRVDTVLKTADESIKPKAKLKADKDTGKIVIDEETTLSGIPPVAWTYKLGNRSALEWVLDQYKESKPKDPTIREKFDTYRFADYKDFVIDLLQRVCAVSVQTQAIILQMTKD